MQKDIHPEYREVLFHDKSMDYYFIVRSTLKTDETKEWEDGKTYPYCVLDISSASHPFYTGKQKLVDTGGRVDKFRKRFGNKTKPTPEAEMASEENQRFRAAEISTESCVETSSRETTEEATPEEKVESEDSSEEK